jgi:hypothetical protein
MVTNEMCSHAAGQTLCDVELVGGKTPARCKTLFRASHTGHSSSYFSGIWPRMVDGSKIMPCPEGTRLEEEHLRRLVEEVAAEQRQAITWSLQQVRLHQSITGS